MPKNSDLLIAAELLAALTNDNRTHPAHFESWRLLKLYNEILCDRGSFVVTQDLGAVVSMLVKVQTGVQEINAESYLPAAMIPRQGVDYFDSYNWEFVLNTKEKIRLRMKELMGR